MAAVTGAAVLHGRSLGGRSEEAAVLPGGQNIIRHWQLRLAGLLQVCLALAGLILLSCRSGAAVDLTDVIRVTQV